MRKLYYSGTSIRFPGPFLVRLRQVAAEAGFDSVGHYVRETMRRDMERRHQEWRELDERRERTA